MNNNDVLLTIKNISGYYGENKNLALDNINITLKKREILSLVGESGSGKSTLLKSIIGIDSNLKITNGEILFEDKNLLKLNKEEKRKLLGKKIALIPQNPMSSFNPLRNFKVQFQEVCKSHNVEYDEKEIERIFTKFGLKDSQRILNSHPYDMSGGMIQRIAIALSLLLKPSILLCDEITSALDVVSQKGVIEEILKVNEEFNVGIIFITHDLSVAKGISNNVAFMEKGKILDYGDVNEILVCPRSEYVCKFLENLCSLANCKKIEGNITYDEYLNSDENILEIKNASKKYENIDVLKNFNLILKRGESLGLVGESGSGKSTILKIVSGLDPLDSGNILLDGIDISKNKPQQIGKELQIIFQDPISSFNPSLSVRTSINDVLNNYIRLGLKDKLLDVNELVKGVELNEELMDKKAKELSGGQCQRFCIVRALATNPRLLLCDEITSALDVVTQNQVIKILKKLKEMFNLSMIFVSHDLSVVSNICDRIIVLKNGEIVEEGLSYDVVNNPKSEYTKLLLESVYDV